MNVQKLSPEEWRKLDAMLGFVVRSLEMDAGWTWWAYDNANRIKAPVPVEYLKLRILLSPKDYGLKSKIIRDSVDHNQACERMEGENHGQGKGDQDAARS